MKIYHNFIGGAWMQSLARRRLPNVNPANRDDVLGAVPLATNDEAIAAVEVAAHATHTWRATPLAERGAILARAARMLSERAETIAGVIAREQGMMVVEALAETRLAAEYLAFRAATPYAMQTTAAALSPAERAGYTARRPLGAVAILSSWESPLFQPARLLASALITGNAAVLKPDPHTPESAEVLLRCLVDAGAPPGVVNLVHGDDDIGMALVEHPAVRAAAFGGARATAANIARHAAAHSIRVYSESAAANPTIVLEDADLEQALTGVISGAFGHAGQQYAATKRVILLHPVADAFLEELTARAGALRPGLDVGPCIDETHLTLALELAREASAQGAELLCGGTHAATGALAKGFFLRPTVIDRVTPEMRVSQEPAPGPLLAVTRVESFAEALDLANSAPANVAASIYTRDGARMFHFVDAVDASAVYVNAPPTGDAAPPLDALLDFFSETRAVSIDYGTMR